jgi:excisionase family DNA binding protein
VSAPALLTVKQAAGRLALGESTVRDLIRSGRLRAYKLGGAIRVGEDAIAALLEASSLESRPAPQAYPPSRPRKAACPAAILEGPNPFKG